MDISTKVQSSDESSGQKGSPFESLNLHPAFGRLWPKGNTGCHRGATGGYCVRMIRGHVQNMFLDDCTSMGTTDWPTVY